MSKRPYTTKLNKLGLDLRKNLSKQEEIGILETLHDAFKGTGNYLEKLFSKEMTEWASREIENDWVPDIHSTMVTFMDRSCYNNTRAEKAEERATALERRLRVAEEEYRKLSYKMSEISGRLATSKKAEEVLVRLTEAMVEATKMVQEGEI